MQPVIKVENLGKSYLIGHHSARGERYVALRDVLAQGVKDVLRKSREAFLGRQVLQGDEVEEFWALRNVAFEVGQGEVVGIIGRNGAGKSTLLKVLSRITEPTEGKVTIRGRVASLLEVGTGFHPELTGRENIFLNGAILGMSKAEIRSKFDEIVAFAEVEKFIDTPVKRYSSGMYVRLAFAVAAHLEPEILVVDEVLAVGDARFQQKCIGKMKDVSSQGRTILFVSHNISAIKSLCSRAIYLSDGKLHSDGSVEYILDQYLEKTHKNDSKKSSFNCELNKSDFQLHAAKLCDEHGKEKGSFECEEEILLEMSVIVRKPIPALYGYIAIKTSEGIVVLESDSMDFGENTLDSLEIGKHILDFTIPRRCLCHGSYNISISFASPQTDTFIVDDPKKHLFFSISDSFTKRGNNRNGFLGTLIKWNLKKSNDQNT